MLVIVSVSLVVLLLSILESYGILKQGLELGFFLLALVSAIRYNYGNDYMSYYEIFQDAAQMNIRTVVSSASEFRDPGWMILCYMFKPVGFFGFVAALSIFSSAVYCRFIRENVPQEHIWIATFIYIFDWSIFPLQLSMMRQGLVITLFVLSYHFLKKKQILIPTLLILFGATLHGSALIIFPFLFVCMFPFERGRIWAVCLAPHEQIKKVFLVERGYIWAICLVSIFFVLFLNKNAISDIFSRLITIDRISDYEKSYGQWEAGRFGIRSVLHIIPFFVSLYYLLDWHTIAGPRYLVFLSCIGTIILPFTQLIALISRIAYYFNIFLIVSVPITYYNIKNRLIRYSFLSVFFIVTVFEYILFFKEPSVYAKYYAIFHTIFEAL